MLPIELAAQERYQVGVCDWMVLKRQKLAAFELAKQLGCDGIELDMGSLGQREAFDNKLRDDLEAAHFKRVADSLGVKVGAMAMSGFYAQDLSKKDTYLSLVGDCFDTMDKMGGVRVAFLPLGGCGNDWTTDKQKRSIIVRRLHEIGEAAKLRGKVVGRISSARACSCDCTSTRDRQLMPSPCSTQRAIASELPSVAAAGS